MIRLFKRYFKDFKFQLFVGPLMKIIEAIFELIVPLVVADLIDNGVNAGDGAYVRAKAVWLFVLAVVGLCSTLCCQYLASKASQGIGTALRRDIFEKMTEFSKSDMDALGKSSYLTRLTADVDSVQVAAAMLIRLVIRAPFLVIGSTIMAFTIDARVAPVFVGFAVLMSLVAYLIMKKTVPVYKKVQRNTEHVTTSVDETLVGMRTIRSFNGEDEQIERFDTTNTTLKKAETAVAKISSFLNPTSYLLVYASVVIILLLGGNRVNVGSLTQGDVVALVSYMTQISVAVVVVADLVTIFTRAQSSSLRLAEILNVKPSIEYGTQDLPAPEFKNALDINGVSFGYGGEKQVLQDVSVSLEIGKSLGITGGTGSGKTTFVSLISRLYDVDDGTITICGRDVKEYSAKGLANIVALVPQKATLFLGTLRDNLLMGNENATDEQMIKALKDASIYSLIENDPKGLDFEIERGGANLSGGQKQRIGIARALLSECKVLLLDDSFSALDFLTEKSIRNNVLARKDIAVVIVSQRLGSVIGCDEIMVLDGGKCVGKGKHNDLYDSCVTYKEICESQEVGKC